MILGNRSRPNLCLSRSILFHQVWNHRIHYFWVFKRLHLSKNSLMIFDSRWYEHSVMPTVVHFTFHYAAAVSRDRVLLSLKSRYRLSCTALLSLNLLGQFSNSTNLGLSFIWLSILIFQNLVLISCKFVTIISFVVVFFFKSGILEANFINSIWWLIGVLYWVYNWP